MGYDGIKTNHMFYDFKYALPGLWTFMWEHIERHVTVIASFWFFKLMSICEVSWDLFLIYSSKCKAAWILAVTYLLYGFNKQQFIIWLQKMPRTTVQRAKRYID